MVRPDYRNGYKVPAGQQRTSVLAFQDAGAIGRKDRRWQAQGARPDRRPQPGVGVVGALSGQQF
jgi:hypothetical protein